MAGGKRQAKDEEEGACQSGQGLRARTQGSGPAKPAPRARPTGTASRDRAPVPPHAPARLRPASTSSTRWR